MTQRQQQEDSPPRLPLPPLPPSQSPPPQFEARVPVVQRAPRPVWAEQPQVEAREPVIPVWTWAVEPRMQEPPLRQRLPTRTEQLSEPGQRERQMYSQQPLQVQPGSPQSGVSQPRSPQQQGQQGPSHASSVLDAPVPQHIRDLIDRIQPTPRTGPWDEAEDNVLLYFIDGGRNKNWVRISARMGFRTAKQCRERFFQSLRPEISHAACTEEEAQIILQKVQEMGTRWAEIARHLGNRSDNWVKNWWNGQRNERSKAKTTSLRAGPTTGRRAAHDPGSLSPTRNRAGTATRARAAARSRDSAAAPSPAETHIVQRALPPLDASTASRHYYPPHQQHQHWNGYSDEDMEGGYYHPCGLAAKLPSSPHPFAEFRPSLLPSANPRQLQQQPNPYGYGERPSTAAPVGVTMESFSSEASPRLSRLSDTGSPGGRAWSLASSPAGSLSTLSSSAQVISSQNPSPALPKPSSVTGQAFVLPHPSEIVSSMADLDQRQRELRDRYAENHKAGPMSLDNILN